MTSQALLVGANTSILHFSLLSIHSEINLASFVVLPVPGGPKINFRSFLKPPRRQKLLSKPKPSIADFHFSISATGLSMFIGNGLIMNWYYLKITKLEIGRFWKNIGKIVLGK